MSETVIKYQQIKCCYECKDRHIGCHGTCERYKAERKALDEYNKQQRRAMQIERLVRPTTSTRRKQR